MNAAKSDTESQILHQIVVSYYWRDRSRHDKKKVMERKYKGEGREEEQQRRYKYGQETGATPLCYMSSGDIL